MLNNPNVRQWLQHLVAIAVFLAVTLVYFSPMLEGKKIGQYDIANWQGMSKEIVDYRDKHHSEPLWTNSMFGGMPAYQISVMYKANVAQYVDKILMLGLPDDAGYAFLFFIGFYFLLVTLNVDKRVAIFGALAFGFSSYFFIFIETGHTGKVHAIGYMAPVMAGVIMCYRKNILAGAAIVALALSLELYANHLQITYYLMMLVMVYILTEIYRTVKEKSWGNFFKASAALLVAAGLAGLTNITNIWATSEYGKYSTRGPSDLTITDAKNRTSGLDKDYAVDWSYGISESLTLLIPDAKGGASGRIGNEHREALNAVPGDMKQVIGQQDQYWGDQAFTAGPAYAGAIACLLFVAGLIFVRGPLRWWLLGGTVLSLLLAWGKNFMPFTDFFLDYVPGYNKFRAVSTMIVVAEFCIPLLAALALDNIVKNPNIISESKNKIKWLVGGMFVFVIFITAIPSMTGLRKTDEFDKMLNSIKEGQPNIPEKQIVNYLDGMMPQLEVVRETIFRADAIRTLAFMLLAAALVWAFWKFKFEKRYLIIGMILLVLLDMWPVARRYLDKKDFVSRSKVENPFPMTQSDQMIKNLEPKHTYRVLNVAANTFNDASTSYYHQSLGGYHGAKLKRYKELIDYYLAPATAHIQSGLEAKNMEVRTYIENHPVLNMLDAKYIIYSPEGGIIRNEKALGNAWFVNEYKLVANADSEILSLQRINPKVTAVIDKKFSEALNGFTATPDSSARITLDSYEPNDLVYTSHAGTEQLAVFSEIYYDKGWNAYVDGKLTPYVRADYVLRAMRVPAGNHKIEFKFEPKVYETGEKISFASSLILLLGCAGVLLLEIRRSARKKIA
jgi:hypothetical protein